MLKLSARMLIAPGFLIGIWNIYYAIYFSPDFSLDAVLYHRAAFCGYGLPLSANHGIGLDPCSDLGSLCVISI